MAEANLLIDEKVGPGASPQKVSAACGTQGVVSATALEVVIAEAHAALDDVVAPTTEQRVAAAFADDPRRDVPGHGGLDLHTVSAGTCGDENVGDRRAAAATGDRRR